MSEYRQLNHLVWNLAAAGSWFFNIFMNNFVDKTYILYHKIKTLCYIIMYNIDVDPTKSSDNNRD